MHPLTRFSRKVSNRLFGTAPSMRPAPEGRPEITLVIASYKYGHLAAQAIESALSQSHPFAKIFFVDDAAGDCAHLEALYPQLDYVLRETNLGVVANFQDMLMRVETERVMFLGADNWLRDDTVEILGAVDADVVTYDIFVTGNLRDEILERHPSEVHRQHGGWYWDRSAGHHGSMLFNAPLAREVGGYASKTGRTDEDKVLYERLLEAGARRRHVAQALLQYRRHVSNFNPC